MKKLLVLILALVMVFSLASCKTKCEKKGHLDEDANGVCDRCDFLLTADSPHDVHTDTDANGYCDGCGALFINYGDNKVVGTLLRKSLEKQFDEINSAKLEFTFDFESASEVWQGCYYNENDELIYYTVSETYSDHYDVDMWISRTADGFNAKMMISSTRTYLHDYSDETGEEPEIEYESKLIYLIDGNLYEQITNDYYVKSEVNSSITEIIGKLSEVQFLSEKDKNELLDAFGSEVATVLNLKDNKGSVSVDLKDDYDELVAYLMGIDFENDTLEDVIDDALALVSEGLTVEAIITELERFTSLNVNDGFAELDAWLTENHGTTFQGIYDSVVNNSEFVEFLKSVIVTVNQMDTADPEFEEEFREAIETLQTFNMAEFIVEREMEDMTVYDFINFWLGERLAPAENLFPNLRESLDVTVAQYDEALDGKLTHIRSFLDSITVKEFNAKLDVNFKNVLEVTDVNGSFNFSASRIAPSDYEGRDNSWSVTVRATFKAYQLSTSTLNLALDSDIEILDRRLIDGYFETEEGYLYTDYYVLDGQVYVSFGGAYPVSDTDSVYFASEDIFVEEVLGDEIVIGNLSLEYLGVSVIAVDGAIIKIKLDVEDGTVEYLETAEFITPPLAYTVFVDIINNDGEPLEGYSYVGIESISGYVDDVRIGFSDDSMVDAVYCTVSYGEDENILICTITGFIVDTEHSLYKIDMSTSWYGGCYDLDEIDAYFGGDPTFLIEFDPTTGEFHVVEYPIVEEQYRKFKD